MSKNGIAKQKGIGILNFIDIVNLTDTTQLPYKMCYSLAKSMCVRLPIFPPSSMHIIVIVCSYFILPMLHVKNTRNFPCDPVADSVLPVPWVPG